MNFRLLLLAAAVGLAGCSGTEDVKYEYPNASRGKTNFYAKDQEGLFGKGGISILGGDEAGNQPGGGSGIAVNSFLWRASLDTVSFMPLASADPFGGVIITDWYSAPDVPNERTKMQIYILDRELRSDGLRVSVFRQRLDDGRWVSAQVSPRTTRQIEDSILTRARELRVKSASES
ncbi:MAG: DUF3576 domain-containing protein [Alphaproteobacteria bacterium]|nr:DUF3576 domain-containing protein [Alphaproteobacteria bacterium]MCB9931660.1 DUF3576 domain-containing protein [Alphaproteobacteria bacterium]